MNYHMRVTSNCATQFPEIREKGDWKRFLSRRFTSFRFAWGFFSLFLSVATFSIVLTDRLPWLDFYSAVIGCLAVFFIASLFFDTTGLRQAVNQSESNSNPQMMDLCKDVKDIKARLKA